MLGTGFLCGHVRYVGHGRCGKISGGSVRSATGVCFLTPWKTVQMEIPVLSEDGAAA